MKRAVNIGGLTCAAIAWVVISATGVMPLRAQTGGGTLAGNVVDQAGKPVEGAVATVKTEAGSASGNATADSKGHFAVTGLAAGTYSVEVTSPGFARNTRRGVPVSASGSQEITITMNVDAISQSVTVQETVLLATE